MGRNRHETLFGLLLLLSLVPGAMVPSAYGETRYVSDRLIITLREQPDDASPTIATLKTDAPVDVLEERQRFLRVRTAEGREGWVQEQYITDELPKAKVIERLETDMARLREAAQGQEARRREAEDTLASSMSAAEEKLRDLSSHLSIREQELAKVREEFARVSREFETLKRQSADVMQIAEDRERLRKEQEALGSEVRTLRAENEDLRRERMIRWFLAGAGVFFVGWLSGKVSRKKKSYY